MAKLGWSCSQLFPVSYIGAVQLTYTQQETIVEELQSSKLHKKDYFLKKF